MDGCTDEAFFYAPLQLLFFQIANIIWKNISRKCVYIPNKQLKYLCGIVSKSKRMINYWCISPTVPNNGGSRCPCWKLTLTIYDPTTSGSAWCQADHASIALLLSNLYHGHPVVWIHKSLQADFGLHPCHRLDLYFCALVPLTPV